MVMVKMLTRIFLVLALCCVLVVDGCGRSTCTSETSTTAPTTPRADDTNVRISVINEIQEPHFAESVYLPFTAGQQLIRYLEEAAERSNTFKFSATYFDNLGYFINTINGLSGKWDPDRTWWAILSGGSLTSTGVSSYMPENGEHIIFKFTKSVA